jgi:hypothetical protein
MNRYISTLWASMDPCISARIIISYYSQTRTKSPRFYDTVTVRVGNSVVQISNVPLADLLRTLRVKRQQMLKKIHKITIHNPIALRI